MANPLLDALQRRDSYAKSAENILDKAESEGRGLTPAEKTDIDRLREKVDRSNTEIQAREYFQAGQQIDFRPRNDSARAFMDGGGMGNGVQAEGKVFRNLGEQLQAIQRAGMPDAQVDPRLYTVRAAASGANESAPSDGGFLLEPTFTGEVLSRSYQTGALASRCRRVPIGANSNGVKIPTVDETSRATGSRLGGVRVYRAAEADTVTASKQKFGRLEMNLEKLMGIGYATDEMLQDSAQLGAIMGQAFTEEIAFTLDDEILEGSGVGQCLGILNSPALITVPKVVNQTADTVVLANLTTMWSRMFARSRGNAAWFINQDIEPQLFQLSLTIGTGGAPVYLPGGGLSAQPFATLFGRPVIPVEQCSALGDKGDIVLADLSQYLLIDKTAQTATSMHVRFIYDEMAFRFTYRVNGQPTWKKDLTPFKGSNTVSPFVTLEAR